MSETYDFLERMKREGRVCSIDLLRALLNSVESAAFIVCHDIRTILWANLAAGRVFRCDAAELLGESTAVLHIDAQSYVEFGERSGQIVTKGRPFRDRYWMRRKDGTRFPSEHLVTPVQDVAGQRLTLSFVIDLCAVIEQRLGRDLQRLSVREREVFQHTIRGLTVAQIAARLNLSRRTVEVHRANMLKKLEVPSTTQLMAELLAVAVMERAWY